MRTSKSWIAQASIKVLPIYIAAKPHHDVDMAVQFGILLRRKTFVTAPTISSAENKMEAHQMKCYAIRDNDGDVMTIFAAAGRRDAIKVARLIDVAVGHCTGVDLCHTVDRATRKEVKAFEANLRR